MSSISPNIVAANLPTFCFSGVFTIVEYYNVLTKKIGFLNFPFVQKKPTNGNRLKTRLSHVRGSFQVLPGGLIKDPLCDIAAELYFSGISLIAS